MYIAGSSGAWVRRYAGAPGDYVLGRTGGAWATVDALQEILRKRGVEEPVVRDWVQDCRTTLSAAIKDDAVWVNRSAAFDAKVAAVGPALSRTSVWDLRGDTRAARSLLEYAEP